MYYVYSTLSNDNAYAIYAENDVKSLPIVQRSILIKGGANVANKNIITPKGVVTEVSDEEMALLEKDFHFNQHRENGFIQVEKRQENPDKVAADMEEKDESAPITPDDVDNASTSADVEDKPKKKKKGKK